MEIVLLSRIKCDKKEKLQIFQPIRIEQIFSNEHFEFLLRAIESNIAYYNRKLFR
jgi:hypothetical protein